jgi:hypothetical protein
MPKITITKYFSRRPRQAPRSPSSGQLSAIIAFGDNERRPQRLVLDASGRLETVSEFLYERESGRGEECARIATVPWAASFSSTCRDDVRS